MARMDPGFVHSHIQKGEWVMNYCRFEGVASAFYTWINGQFVGYAEDTRSPRAAI